MAKKTRLLWCTVKEVVHFYPLPFFQLAQRLSLRRNTGIKHAACAETITESTATLSIKVNPKLKKKIKCHDMGHLQTVWTSVTLSFACRNQRDRHAALLYRIVENGRRRGQLWERCHQTQRALWKRGMLKSSTLAQRLSCDGCNCDHIPKMSLLGLTAQHLQGVFHRQGPEVVSEGGRHARLPQSLHHRSALREQQQRFEPVLHHGRVFPTLRPRRRQTQGVAQRTVW